VAWLFKKGLSPGQRASALAFIALNQRTNALQQLAKETYDAAIVRCAAQVDPGDNLLRRGEAEFVDVEAVRTQLLPALEYRRELADRILEEHRAFTEMAAGAPAQVQACYAADSRVWGVYRDRCQALYASISSWVEDPTRPQADLAGLDRVETELMLYANVRFQEVTRLIGFEYEDWLAASGSAIDQVRGEIGLPPLGPAEYSRRFMMGAAGGQIRFFE
jgi:hypothetical protein